MAIESQVPGYTNGEGILLKLPAVLSSAQLSLGGSQYFPNGGLAVTSSSSTIKLSGVFLHPEIHSFTYLLNISFISLKLIYLTVVACRCGMWDLVPRPGIKPRPPALEV